MYEVICKYCGTKKTYDHYGEFPRVFCNAECQRAYAAKQKREKRAEARNALLNKHMSPTITPEEQCRRCAYGSCVGGFWSCSYFEIEETSRIFKHLPGTLPSECQEFKPKRRAHQRKAQSIK